MWIALAVPAALLCAAAIRAEPVHPPAPVALWCLDETGGTNVVDGVGGHNGVVAGTNALRVSGKFGLALDLNNPATGGGSALSYATVPDFLYASATGMSVSLWFKVAKNEDGNNDYWYRLIGHGTDGADLMSAYMYNNAVGRYGALRVANGGSAAAVDTSAINLNNGQWHHLAMSFTLGVGQGIYVDGVCVLTNGSAAALDNPTGAIYFGRVSTSAAYGYPGSFDEIAFFNVPLSADHVAWLWNGGSGNSLSGSVPGILLPVPGSDGGGVSNTFYIGKFEVISADYALFLNEAEAGGQIGVQSGRVVRAGASELYSLTDAAAPGAHVRYDPLAGIGTRFSALPDKAEHPAIFVSWFGAAAFCNWLNSREGLATAYSPDGNWALANGAGYRLPTEAEWVKAAAWDKTAGRFVLYGTGKDTIDVADANFLNSGDASETNAIRTASVGNYLAASPYNLRDTCGNVWEWCHDLYDPAATNAAIAAHALRGGAWGNLAEDVSAATRIDNPPAAVRNSVGFRVVKSGSN